MAFRRKRAKPRVFWLPSTGRYTNRVKPTVTGPTSQSPTQHFSLIGYDDQSPEAALVNGGSYSSGRLGPTGRLVIDRVVGKVYWDVKNLLTSPAPDAEIAIRMAIVKISRQAFEGAQQEGVGANDLFSLDVSTAGAAVMGGSDSPRYIWWRAWQVRVGPIAIAQCENMCPPGPYVDVKPRCNLRQNELLLLLCQGQVNPEATDGSWSASFNWSHDLRVLAHHKPGI